MGQTKSMKIIDHEISNAISIQMVARALTQTLLNEIYKNQVAKSNAIIMALRAFFFLLRLDM